MSMDDMDDGRSPLRGSGHSDEPASGLAANAGSVPNAGQEVEFCARFKARMLAVAGPMFDGGESVADYADETAPTYWETDWQRALGPEECADADMSYWGDE